ncbi:DOPA 4,5-dioxygenase [Chaetoceros tenuissimus]|uniref:DOPA 4,5-dioxygenase n=1 Tax=Chaetoceros tenuissimus TaxID=426638 RepID=A0AAD3H4M4_9STRA|nr:DOPA 4,5-dioxygenase [Chaetoceros tenuissimus]
MSRMLSLLPLFLLSHASFAEIDPFQQEILPEGGVRNIGQVCHASNNQECSRDSKSKLVQNSTIHTFNASNVADMSNSTRRQQEKQSGIIKEQGKIKKDATQEGTCHESLSSINDFSNCQQDEKEINIELPSTPQSPVSPSKEESKPSRNLSNYKVFVYYSGNEEAQNAIFLRERMKMKFKSMKFFPLQDRIVGHHPKKMWEVSFESEIREGIYHDVIEYLESHSRGLSVLIHPERYDSGDDLYWINEAFPQGD